MYVGPKKGKDQDLRCVDEALTASSIDLDWPFRGENGALGLNGLFITFPGIRFVF